MKSPATTTHAAQIARWLRRSPDARRDFGIEIGAFDKPIPGLRPLFIDRFPSFGNPNAHADYFGDMANLPIRDHSLDYVASSHVLEHAADPVRALFEWARVLRPGGIIYMVVPDRRFTFDHTRDLTPPEHLLDDFARGITDNDPTHIGDYLDRMDWTRWAPGATAEEHAATRERLRAAYSAASAAGEPINIHFHVFERANLVRLIGLLNAHPRRTADLEIMEALECFPADCPNGLLLVIRVRKPVLAMLRAWLFRFRSGGKVTAALLPHARRWNP